MTHCSPSFNVDGAVGGKLGPAGISCVVLKASGDVVAAFSSPMGVKDGSNKAKMLVRREALRILYQSLKLADKFGFSFLWLPHLQFFLCYCADAATNSGIRCKIRLISRQIGSRTWCRLL